MNNKMVSLIINGVIAVLALIGVYFVVQAMQTTMDPETQQAVGDTGMVDNSVGFSLYLVYGCLALIGVFTVWAIITNPKRFIPTVIGLVIFGAVILIAYLIANVETTGVLAEHPNSTEGWLKWGDVGIKATFILILIAIVTVLVGVVRGALGFFSK